MSTDNKSLIEKFVSRASEVSAPEGREKDPYLPVGYSVLELLETEIFAPANNKNKLFAKARFKVHASDAVPPGSIVCYLAETPHGAMDPTRAQYTLQDMLKIGICSLGADPRDPSIMKEAWADKTGLLSKWGEDELKSENLIRCVVVEKLLKNGNKIEAIQVLEPAPEPKHWPGAGRED